MIHRLSPLPILAAVLLAGAVALALAAASGVVAAEGTETYVGCGLEEGTAPSHRCAPTDKGDIGAFFRSPVDTTYELCVDFPTGKGLCVKDQPAIAGTLYANKLTTTLGGSHLVTWRVAGQVVGTWAFTVPLQPPVFGHTVAASPVSGRVLVKTPTSGGFVPLSAAADLPAGSVFDTRSGVVELESARSPHDEATQSGRFHAGVFRVTQKSIRSPFGRRARVGTTLLTLSGALPCPQPPSAALARPGKKRRRLWGNAHGNFQTKGKHAAATVGGTKWLTEDSCEGTRVKVARGRVYVTDFGRRRMVLVKAPHSYLARPRGGR